MTKIRDKKMFVQRYKQFFNTIRDLSKVGTVEQNSEKTTVKAYTKYGSILLTSDIDEDDNIVVTYEGLIPSENENTEPCYYYLEDTLLEDPDIQDLSIDYSHLYTGVKVDKKGKIEEFKENIPGKEDNGSRYAEIIKYFTDQVTMLKSHQSQPE